MIERVAVRPFSWPFWMPGRASAGRAWRQREGFLVRIDDHDGCWGQGEASPLPGYSPDTLVEARAELDRLASEHLRTEQLGTDDCDRSPVDQVRALVAAARVAAPSVRCAIETAALDLLARRAGKSCAEILAGSGVVAPVECATLLAGNERVDLVGAAWDAYQRGFRVMKVKIGGRSDDPTEDIARIAALREVFGDSIAIRVDANGKLPLSRAVDWLKRLAPLAIEHLEEPVALDELGCLAGTLASEAEQLPVIALDESLQDPGAWEEARPLVRTGVVKAVVLKPMALGGILRCLELAAQARSLGAAVAVTHMFDGPVGLAAAMSLALAIPAVRACGLDPSYALGSWLPGALPWFPGCSVVDRPAPGLGLPWMPAPS
ncbi:MAG: enolase C-terminal domain-like protein [Pseudomonadota bacterium]